MIDETTLTKGQLRKLNAIRKLVGDEIAAKAFAEWMKAQVKEEKEDPIALALVEAATPVLQGVNLGRYGYTVRRSRAGVMVTRNTAKLD